MSSQNDSTELTLQPLRTTTPAAAAADKPQRASRKQFKRRRLNKQPSLYEHAILKRATSGEVLARTVSPTDLVKMRISTHQSKKGFIALLRKTERVNNNNLVWGTLYSAWDFLTG
jgi:hypothetical protein